MKVSYALPLLIVTISSITTEIAIQQCFNDWNIGFVTRLSSINKLIFKRFQDLSVAPGKIGPEMRIPPGGTYGELTTVTWEDVKISNIELRATNVYVHEGRLDVLFKAGNINVNRFLVKPDGQPLNGSPPLKYSLQLTGKKITFIARVTAELQVTSYNV